MTDINIPKLGLYKTKRSFHVTELDIKKSISTISIKENEFVLVMKITKRTNGIYDAFFYFNNKTHRATVLSGQDNFSYFYSLFEPIG